MPFKIEQPDRPNLEFYDIAVLYLTAERERQPGDPPFNPKFKVKRFEGSGAFYFFENGAMVARVIPPEEDGVNFLPDIYPAYVVKPTGSTLGGLPVQAEYLSTAQDAVALMNELHGTGFTDDAPGAIYPRAEMRRAYGFSAAGVRVNAGALLKERNSRGVGHPGDWVSTPDQGTVWVNDPDPVIPDHLQTWGIPCADLLPDEQIVPYVATILGMTYRIHRTDLSSPPPAGGVGLTALQEHKLDQAVDLATQNQALLAKIAAALGVR